MPISFTYTPRRDPISALWQSDSPFYKKHCLRERWLYDLAAIPSII
jgi:hypothetical protein